VSLINVQHDRNLPLPGQQLGLWFFRQAHLSLNTFPATPNPFAYSARGSLNFAIVNQGAQPWYPLQSYDPMLLEMTEAVPSTVE
jgi:hypothetical protein